ncbi:MAG TPA: 30S ribosomal protein S21 [Saprospiraceae bacterium]|nr:30S ribosomal protein S21 [Saprospiraceae bacterium]
MLIIDVKDGESIERALRRYKRKYRNSKMMREIRKRREYKKPSVERRNQIQKAVYRDKVKREIGQD